MGPAWLLPMTVSTTNQQHEPPGQHHTSTIPGPMTKRENIMNDDQPSPERTSLQYANHDLQNEPPIMDNINTEQRSQPTTTNQNSTISNKPPNQTIAARNRLPIQQRAMLNQAPPYQHIFCAGKLPPVMTLQKPSATCSPSPPTLNWSSKY